MIAIVGGDASVVGFVTVAAVVCLVVGGIAVYGIWFLFETIWRHLESFDSFCIIGLHINMTVLIRLGRVVRNTEGAEWLISQALLSNVDGYSGWQRQLSSRVRFSWTYGSCDEDPNVCIICF